MQNRSPDMKKPVPSPGTARTAEPTFGFGRARRTRLAARRRDASVRMDSGAGRRPGPGAHVRIGRRLSFPRRQRRLHRNRGDLPARRRVADPRFLPSRSEGDPSRARRLRICLGRPATKAPERGAGSGSSEGERVEPHRRPGFFSLFASFSFLPC
jgi:hypothetical protein